MPNEVKKGSYGMFSGAGVADYSTKIFGSTASSKQHQSQTHSLRLNLKRKILHREESPLFEPERGISIDSDDSVADDDARLISPGVQAARSQRKEKKKPGSHHGTRSSTRTARSKKRS